MHTRSEIASNDAVADDLKACELELVDLCYASLCEVTTSMLWYPAIPLVVVFCLVMIAHDEMHRRLRRKLLGHAALAEQLLELEEPEREVRGRWLWRAFALVACMVAGSLLLGQLGLDRWIAVLAGVTLVTLCVLILLWEREARKKRPVGLVASPLYTWRSSLIRLSQLGLLILSVGCFLLTFAVSARIWATQVYPVQLDRLQASIDTWNEKLKGMVDETPSNRTILQVNQERAKRLMTKLRQQFEGGSKVLLGVDTEIATDLWSMLILACCLFGYLSLSVALLRIHVRSPFVLVLVTILLAVALDWVSGRAASFLERAALLNYVTRFGIVLAIYMVGQLSAFAIMLRSEAGEVCPRCSFTVGHRQQRCRVCGSKLGLMQGAQLVGNPESRKLHHPTCHHIRTLKEARRVRFLDPQAAYWSGFNNCGDCLGGSNYTRREKGREKVSG